MLDIKFIRNFQDLIKEAARKKHIDFDVEELLKVDKERLEILQKKETSTPEQLEIWGEKLKKVTTDLQVLMSHVPNIPDMTVPEGENASDNVEVKTWGEKPNFAFVPKDYILDFEKEIKVEEFRLILAIWQYAINFWTSKNYVPILTGTKGASLIGMFPGEVLEYLEENPKKYIGFSFDAKGLWEQVVFCKANHETSVLCHEEINRNTEEFIESFKLPYRTVLNCAGDMGLGQVKKYTTELWVPKENKYSEISSASYFHDFQTRRGNIKYLTKDGTTKFAHSLNCTAIPSTRILVSLIENYQNLDGSMTIPDVLRPHMGGQEKIMLNCFS